MQVPTAHIVKTEVTPDIDNEQLLVKVHGSSAAEDAIVSAVVTEHGNHVTTVEGKIGQEFTIEIPKPKLWSPDSPNLYDLELSLASQEEAGTAQKAADSVILRPPKA